VPLVVEGKRTMSLCVRILGPTLLAFLVCLVLAPSGYISPAKAQGGVAYRRVAANECLDLLKNGEIIRVGSKCSFPVEISVCTLSKTNAVLKALGSWVAGYECTYHNTRAGYVRSIVLANDNSSAIWMILSEAGYKISATKEVYDCYFVLECTRE
jgi:hypothetical protein